MKDEEGPINAAHELRLMRKDLHTLVTDFGKHVDRNAFEHQSITDELERHRLEEERQNKVILGTPKEPGVMERIRFQERLSGVMLKTVAALLSLVMIGLAKLIWDVIEHHMSAK